MNKKARADVAIEAHARRRKAVSPNFLWKHRTGSNDIVVKNANATAGMHKVRILYAQKTLKDVQKG